MENCSRDGYITPPDLPPEKTVSGSKATVRTGHGTIVWFQVRKGVLTLFYWAPKSLQMVTAVMKLKDAYSLEGKL